MKDHRTSVCARLRRTVPALLAGGLFVSPVSGEIIRNDGVSEDPGSETVYVGTSQNGLLIYTAPSQDTRQWNYRIGWDHTGTMDVQGGSIVSMQSLTIAYDGILKLSGGLVDVTLPALLGGGTGPGTVEIGTMGELRSPEVVLGATPESAGAVRIDGLLITREIIRYGADGAVIFNGGALRFVDGAHYFGSSAGIHGFSDGSVTVAEGGAVFDVQVPTASITSSMGGSGAVTKAGPGTLTLPGSHAYIGATTVTEGTLVVNGSIAGSALTTVRTGGILSGTGTVGALKIENGGILSPGNSPGTLTAGDTTWLGGGTYLWEINNATGEADTNWDQLAIEGTLSLAAISEANPFTIDIRSLTAGNTPGEAENFDPAQSYWWILVATTEGISGFDEGKFLINASGFANAPDASRFSLSSTGTRLILTYSAVPEPATWGAVLGVGLLTLAALRRRRRVVS